MLVIDPELNDCRRAGRAAPPPYNAYNTLFVSH